jgi:pimeloyl-ACP methyl ester carboxylesterase
MASNIAYGNGTLPAGVRSRHIANVNGMTVHILEAGYHVIAPDQRGSGRTTGWDDSYDAGCNAPSLLSCRRNSPTKAALFPVGDLQAGLTSPEG